MRWSRTQRRLQLLIAGIFSGVCGQLSRGRGPPAKTMRKFPPGLGGAGRGDGSEAQPPRAGRTDNPTQNWCPGMKRCGAPRLLLQAECRVSCCGDSKADRKHSKAGLVFRLLREVSSLSAVLRGTNGLLLGMPLPDRRDKHEGTLK